MIEKGGKETNSDGKIFHIETEHGTVLRTFFEVLKDALNEAVIEITKGSTTPDKIKKIIENESDSESDDETSNNSTDDSTDDSNSESNDESDNESEEESDEDTKKKTKKKNTTETKDMQQTNTSTKKGGMKILTLNEQKTLILHAKLHSDRFLKFDCKYELFNLGINLVEVHSFMRNIDRDGVLSMYIDEDNKQRIIFQVLNSEKGVDSKYKLKLMDINKKQYNIPPPDFDMHVTMSCEEFHKMCREMNNLGSYLAITCSSNKIEFACKGNSSECEKTYVNGGSVSIRVSKRDDKKNNEPKIVREVYELKNINLFNKCVNLCDTVELRLRNKYPLFITYTVGCLGEMTVGLTPADEGLIAKGANYNEEDEKYYESENNIKMKNT